MTGVFFPNMEHKKLGEGGNGVVVEHTICDHVYAVKKVIEAMH